jgi:protein-tyrosine phosphatase
MTYAEIHFHLLPGVDDGPSSIDESLELATLAVSDGTTTAVATPHVHRQHVTDPREISERVRELSDRLRGARIALEVLPGGELALEMVDRLSQPQLDAIAQGPPGRRWLLLEAPFGGLDERYRGAADELRERGFAIVVAHPERALQTAASERVIARELARGSALQVTAWSLAGIYGERVRALALALLRRSSRAVIASDAHGAQRPPALRLALNALAAGGELRACQFVAARPQALLADGLAIRPAARAA